MNKPFVKIFNGIIDHEIYLITNWLKKNGGTIGVDWDEYFEGIEYEIIGMNSDVGCRGNLHITIYDQSVAFQFVLFKVGHFLYNEI